MIAKKPMNPWLEFAIDATVVFVIVFGVLAVGLSSMGNGHAVLRKRSGCQSNLGSICKALALYRGEFNDARPRELALVVKGDSVSRKAFVCPEAGRLDYANCTVLMADAPAKDILLHSSYVYVPLDDNCYGDMCCLFELPINHRQEGANMAAANCGVSWLNNDNFLSRVQNLNDYLYEERERKNVR